MSMTEVSQADGLILDWLAAKCQGSSVQLVTAAGKAWLLETANGHSLGRYNPSGNAASGAALVLSKRIEIRYRPAPFGDVEATWCEGTRINEFGPDALTAGLRAFVTGHLGPQVDVPNEILEAAAACSPLRPGSTPSNSAQLTPELQEEQALILSSGSGLDAYFFADDHHSHGADLKALEARVLEVGDGRDAYSFARLAQTTPFDANITALQERVLSVGNEINAWNFATHIDGANVRALYEHALSRPKNHLSPAVLAMFKEQADQADARPDTDEAADAPAP